MEDEDIVREIRKIEEAADRIIQEAQEGVKEMEAASRKEIERIELEAEKEFEIKAEILRSGLKEEKRREESELSARFEEDKKMLEGIDKEVLRRLTDLIAEKIYEG